MALPGLVAARNLADVTDRERAWDNIGANITRNSLVALPEIGSPFEGGFFAGLISHTADGVPTHALIVAPKSSGATGTGYPTSGNVSWKTTETATLNTNSAFDGLANTNAMVEAGISSHPAANFCVNLVIDGYDDWYFPSWAEMDIAYQNLKPTTTANGTSFGINAYSVPKRTANRLADVPTQTSVLDFQDSSLQSFIADQHWTSTEASSGAGSRGVVISFNTGSRSDFYTGAGKTAAGRVRAFRRIRL